LGTDCHPEGSAVLTEGSRDRMRVGAFTSP
jgi:hypothetical protein